jgi:uncharacterized RDD family membrane protein YckC
MFCQSCGMEVASTYKICPKCGGKSFGAQMLSSVSAQQPVSTPLPPPVGSATVQPGNAGSAIGVQSFDKSHFGSFWRRFGAIMIDGLVVNAIQLIWLIPAMFAGYVLAADDVESINKAFGVMPTIIGTITGLLYVPLMHSSKYQATLGKKWLGMKVVDTNGQRISIARAYGRYFATFLSSLTLCIGYVMVFFTERRQALHDKIAGTYVVYVGR